MSLNSRDARSIADKGTKMDLPLQLIGTVLMVIIAIYFLFMWGHGLATDDFNDNLRFWAWVFAVVLIVLGWFSLQSSLKYFGFLGFLPLCTFFFIKISHLLPVDVPIQKRLAGSLLSAATAAVMYMITHHFFGFGIAEASVSSFIAAAFLGVVGYNA